MPLTPGTRLGPYVVTAQVGVGGMGEVYRATDTSLKRQVAIKVLPAALSADPDRLARFQREAEVLAALNHPNIAHIHGLEKADGTFALVMELVDGPTLAERIATGAIPLDEALPIAKQIAEALEAAHEQGIIHRDLKPANIKVREDGAVKVLDFGLAKAMDPIASSSATPTVSPTISMHATQAGMILGTAAYMSPEQAAGKTVDKRSDIWSFGVVLWEMLTGQRLFNGETVSHTLADVLRAPIAFDALPQATPSGVRDLLKRCLDRDAKGRLRDIGEARIAISRATSGPDVSAPARARAPWAPWAVASAAVIGLAVLAIVRVREVPVAEPVVQLSVSLPQDSAVASLALSPNGRHLVIALALPNQGTAARQLWLRDVDSQALQLLPGTNTAQYPFWSPDSRLIGFFADGKLKTIPASGGPPQVLCDVPNGGGGTWNRDGLILFAADTGPVQRVSTGGGACTPVTEPAVGTNHRFPEFLPDGKHFFYLLDDGEEAQAGVYVRALDQPAGERRVLSDQSSVVFVPPAPGKKAGHLLFLRNAMLMAQPFDAATLQFAGDVVPVVGQASFSTTGFLRQMAASASGTGVIAYVANRTSDAQLAWFDRSGHELEKVIPRGGQRAVALSPDGKTAALQRAEGLWLRDLSRGIDNRFTFPPLTGAAPVWSPAGDQLAFSTGDTLYVKDARGSSPERILQSATIKRPSDWSHDGLLYTEIDPKTRADLWILPDPSNKSADHKPFKFLATEFNETQGQFSPDGRWIAYVSDESGQDEVYVRPFPSGPGQWIVTGNRAVQPRWRRDGKELFYMEGGPTYRWMAVPVLSGQDPVFKIGEPKLLFVLRSPNASPQNNAFAYSPSDDGLRFLVNTTVADTVPQTLNVITNWEKAAASAAKAP